MEQCSFQSWLQQLQDLHGFLGNYANVTYGSLVKSVDSENPHLIRFQTEKPIHAMNSGLPVFGSGISMVVDATRSIFIGGQGSEHVY